MIKINKPRRIPEILKTKGRKETQILKKLFDSDPKSYLNGSKKFNFKNSIYGHKTVKSTLVKAQHDKCCFCEKVIERGDVEHFRGKGGYQQNEGEPTGKPGYYWLAYEWDNLLFSCSTCNSSYKRNFFPLFDTKKRAISHRDNLQLENPIFVHPAKENPEDYIEIIGSSPRAINGNARGQITIDRIGLRRPWINKERAAHYKIYKRIFVQSQDKKLPESIREELFDIVKEAAQNDAPYSLMIRYAIQQNFRF
ncbi:MAG: hypothetical protein AAF573_11515 [Bacteroidota bacterium]